MWLWSRIERKSSPPVLLRVGVGRRRVRPGVGALDAAGAGGDRDAAVGVGAVVVVAAEVEVPRDRRAQRGEDVPGLVRHPRLGDLVGGPHLQEAARALVALGLEAVDVRSCRERVEIRVAAFEVHERDAMPVAEGGVSRPRGHDLTIQGRQDEPPVDAGLRALDRLEVDGELPGQGDRIRFAGPPFDLVTEDADHSLRVVGLPARALAVRPRGRRGAGQERGDERRGPGRRRRGSSRT